MSQSWTFANAHTWMPGLPINPPTSDYEKYEGEWEVWLDENYDRQTNTIFGMNYNDADIEDTLYDRYWQRFMEEVIYPKYDI
jgi:hypothetical protein